MKHPRALFLAIIFLLALMPALPATMASNYTRLNNLEITTFFPGFGNADVIIHIARNETDASLKARIVANPNRENLVEGEYIILHFPNHVWAKYQDPKKLIDTYDSIYKAQLDLTGGKAVMEKVISIIEEAIDESKNAEKIAI